MWIALPSSLWGSEEQKWEGEGGQHQLLATVRSFTLLSLLSLPRYDALPPHTQAQKQWS